LALQNLAPAHAKHSALLRPAKPISVACRCLCSERCCGSELMYGLCLINSHFTSDGSGRDFVVVGDPERKRGKLDNPRPYRTACLGRECHPRKRPTGPRPPSNERTKQLNQGLWQCSGQWTTEAKSPKALPHSPTRTLRKSASDTLKKHASYESGMQAWTDGRLPQLKRNPAGHHDWMRCHTQSLSSHAEPRLLGPALAEPSFIGKTMQQSASAGLGWQPQPKVDMAATAPAAFFAEPRRAHGYMEPGVLRRCAGNRPLGFAGVAVERCGEAREEKFMKERAPHEVEVMRSTSREPRFMPQQTESVDVRRSN